MSEKTFKDHLETIKADPEHRQRVKAVEDAITAADFREPKQLQESSLSKVWGYIKDYTTGCITAYRNDNTRRENQERNRELLAYLQDRGYTVIKVMGDFVENFGTESAVPSSESSFFVVNRKKEGDDDGELEADLVKLGRAFEQDAIMIIPQGGNGAHGVGTSDDADAWLKTGEKETYGDIQFGTQAAKDNIARSRISGRTFAAISEDVELYEYDEPQTIMGLWARSIVAAKVKKRL